MLLQAFEVALFLLVIGLEGYATFDYMMEFV